MKAQNTLLVLYFNFVILLINSNSILGQGQPGFPNYIPDLSPVPANVYEFMKYGDIPVSEYTGVPDIRIPIYTIVEGEIKLPIELKYHASGIKVKEEASWVGLGWSLNFGYITQMVNDRDDFGDWEKILPTPTHNPVPTQFTLRFDYRVTNQQNPCPNLNGGVTFYHSYPYFTDYEYPINGDWAPLKNPYLFNGIGWISNPSNPIDSEPDVFKASFLGHDLEFIIEFGTDNIKILNTKLYKILKLSLPNNGIGWKITDPSGNRYYFEQCDVTYLDESWYESYGGSSGIIDDRVENRVWSITKIETYDEREIIFSYFQTPELENLPSWSQTYHHKIKTGEVEVGLEGGGYWQYKDVIYYGSNYIESLGTHEAVFRVINITKQTISYLDDIEFSEGNLDFNISPRIDCAGTYKLDSILLKHNDDIVKTFSLGFDHFIGHENGGCYGNSGDIYFENFSEEEIRDRLKLVSFQEVGQPPYFFYYNEDYALPKKTSFAVDYWGYYNGMVSNGSLIPNPIQFEVGSNNNNNKSADYSYSISGTLSRIDYPTGGHTKFYYELNSFSNYWVPDKDNLNNTTSHGLGLRVKFIEDYSNEILVKKVEYLYENGQAITPLKIFSGPYLYNRIKQHGSGSLESQVWTIYSFQAWQGTSNNYYLPSLFGSGNYVGYGKVSVIEKGNNVNNGKKILYFVNHPDLAATSVNELISLPTLKDQSYEHNGLVSKEEIYDKVDNLLEETFNQYAFEISDKYYGMKTCFYGFLAWSNFEGGTGLLQMLIKEQDIGIFYAIYSGESILESSTKTIWYDDTPLAIDKTFTYNSLNLLETETFQNSKSETIINTYKYPFNYSGPFMSTLNSLNRINKVVYSEEKNNGSIISKIKNTYFQDDNNLIMVNSISESKGTNPYFTVIYYDDYDIKGNLCQYHLPQNYIITYLWGNNYSEVVAKIENATFNEVISSLSCTYEELQSKTIAQLLSIFDNLRNALPGAFITSYTHKPLIGPTNISDVNGLRTRYSFDEFERLETISDNDYKILQHIDYNYFNPE